VPTSSCSAGTANALVERGADALLLERRVHDVGDVTAHRLEALAEFVGGVLDRVDYLVLRGGELRTAGQFLQYSDAAVDLAEISADVDSRFIF